MTSPIGLINPVTPIPYNYKTIIASQTTVILGGTGNQGDLLYTLLVVPATTSPGSIVLTDGAVVFNVFTGGTVSDLKPFSIPMGLTSANGPWKLTTGANVSVVAAGLFSA